MSDIFLTVTNSFESSVRFLTFQNPKRLIAMKMVPMVIQNQTHPPVG